MLNRTENSILHEKISKLMLEKTELEQENKKLKEERDNFMLKYAKALCEKIVETNELCTERNKLGRENKKLMEFKLKQEEMMFLIGASIESAKPKTALDAEKLQKGKELYEKLYKEELYSLKEENKKLKEENKRLSDFLECES